MDWAAFWQDFWPNLAATVMGIALGVPLALLINRHAVNIGEEKRVQAERAQTADALNVLEHAITDNTPRIKRLAESIKDNKTLFDTGIDTSAWDAVQGTLTSFGNADLRKRVAYHFARLAAVVRLNDRLVSYSAGVESALAGKADAMDALVAAILGAASELEGESPAIAKALSENRAALTGTLALTA